MSFLTFPGSNSPISDEKGNVTNPWRLFFTTVWNRVGGPQPTGDFATVTEAQDYANTAQSNAETFAQSAANMAQSNAESFATTAANTAQSNAETFATTSITTALTNLQKTNVTQETTAGSLTVPAAQLVNGVFIDTAPQTAAFTLTTDTATNILAAFTNAAVGSGFTFRFINNSSAAFPGTLAGGTGVTLATAPANPAVPQGGWADYLFTVTAVGTTPTFTVTPIAGGTVL